MGYTIPAAFMPEIEAAIPDPAERARAVRFLEKAMGLPPEERERVIAYGDALIERREEGERCPSMP